MFIILNCDTIHKRISGSHLINLLETKLERQEKIFAQHLRYVNCDQYEAILKRRAFKQKISASFKETRSSRVAETSRITSQTKKRDSYGKFISKIDN
ncbi:MAG: hypothetical protein MHMPM18_002334 [Marteilia pararefringens]